MATKKNKYMAEPPVEGRECGDCRACCVLPRINAVAEDRTQVTVLAGERAEVVGTRQVLSSLPLLPEGKPGYAPCQHLNTVGGERLNVGCARYDERPPVCREFACLWRSGHIAGDERRRPDRLGLMFTVEEIGGKVGVEAWELWPMAATDHPGRGVLDGLRQHVAHLAVRYYGVPCSLHYTCGGESLMRGNQLSRMAREAPQQLAAYLRAQAAADNIADDPDQQAVRDLESLEAGVPVAEHFTRGGGR